MTWLMVIAGAVVGAPARYLADRAVQARMRERGAGEFPWGTLLVNVFGCLVLGTLTGAAAAGAASSNVQLLVGTGFCGALTTYSTFSFESLRLAEDGARGAALGNVALSLAAGIAAAFAGVALADAIWG
ncbi:fluoride efflux transporter CrcB [Yinghuangia aomiensis]|uniref:fluoride efflux transporter CrcB n=1 Tax=Yinghuangia aomiensis TaxID=676205 RepID=UPI0031F14E82